jgi:hypothetical protein
LPVTFSRLLGGCMQRLAGEIHAVFVVVVENEVPALLEDIPVYLHAVRYTTNYTTNMMKYPLIAVGLLKWTRLCIQADSGHFETLAVNPL